MRRRRHSGSSRSISGVVSSPCQTDVRVVPNDGALNGKEMEERHMFTKILVFAIAVGGIAGLAAMLDVGHARAIDSLVQMPACKSSDSNCQSLSMSSTSTASTERFFTMMAMH